MVVSLMVLANASLASNSTQIPVAATVDSTVGQDPDWDHVPVRRLIQFVEQSMLQGFQWTAFEEDNQGLRSAVIYDASNFLDQLWAQGALFGATASEAFHVDVDASPEDVKNGHLNLTLGLAAVHPGEFVAMKLVLKVQAQQ